MSKDIYQQMTDKIMLTGSKIIPELFRMIADESEAELMMALPGTPDALAEKIGRPVDEVETACLTLYRKGLAFKSFKGGTVGFKMAGFCPVGGTIFSQAVYPYNSGGTIH